MPKLFLVILLVIMQDTVLASQWKPIDVGHPPLMSPHTSPIVFTGGRVFVVNTPSDTVDVIDSGTLEIIARIDVGIDPVTLAVRGCGRAGDPDHQPTHLPKFVAQTIYRLADTP